MKCCIMWHFIRVCTVCFDKVDLQRNKYHYNLYPSIYTMDNPYFIEGSFMGDSIGLKKDSYRAKNIDNQVSLVEVFTRK